MMQEPVASCKEGAVSAMEEFLKALSFVPDDKLTWTPTPTAKSAIRIGAHTALFAGRFARMINERRLPASDTLAEFLVQVNVEEAALTDRAELESAFRKGTDELLAALDSLSPEEVEMTFDTGLGWQMPMVALMKLPAEHALGHGAQIDYLQTCWGDQEVHF